VDGQFSARLQRLPGVDTQVHEHLVDLCGVGEDGWLRLWPDPSHADPFQDGISQQLEALVHHVAEPALAEGPLAPAAEGQDLAQDLAGTVTGAADVAYRVEEFRVVGRQQGGQVTVADDDG